MTAARAETAPGVPSVPDRWERALFWVAVVIWLLGLVLATAAILVGLRYPDSFAGILPASVTTAMYATVGLVGLGYATAGLLILRHRVRHAVGWLLILTGPALVAVFVSAGVGLALHDRGDPMGAWLVLVATVCWWPAVLMAGPGLAILFPDGRFPGPRWRLIFGLSVAALAVTLVAVVVQPAGFGPDGGPPNPLAVGDAPAWVVDLASVVANIAVFTQVLLAVAAVSVRFRRAEGDERQQLEWFASAVIAWGAVFAASWFAEWEWSAVVVLAAFLLVPAAVVIAITRYRLYEIDRLINRTLVYVPLVGIVAGLYAALVLFFGRLFTAVTGDTSDVAAIISALILAAVFTPIRKSVEGIVDTYFKPASPGTGTKAPVTEAAAGSPSAAMWADPAHDAAVERIVRRVLREQDRGRRDIDDDGFDPEVTTSH